MGSTAWWHPGCPLLGGGKAAFVNGNSPPCPCLGLLSLLLFRSARGRQALARPRREEQGEATGEGGELGQLLCRQKTPIPAKVSASPEIAGSSGDGAQPGVIELSGIGDRLHMSVDKSRITVAKLPRPRQARLGTLGTDRGGPLHLFSLGRGREIDSHPPSPQEGKFHGKRLKSLFLGFVVCFFFFYRRGFRAECFCFSVCSRGKNASEPQDVSVGGLILSQITSFGMKERGSSVTICVPR